MAPFSSSALRFEGYELDLKALQLRSAAGPVHLPNQTLQVLLLLVERHGEIVTREDIRRRVWSDDVTVDFDHAIAKAINRLREALNDSVTTPRFIETRSRLGYRFIADVESVPDAPTQPQSAAPSVTSKSIRHQWAGERAAMFLVPLLLVAVLLTVAAFRVPGKKVAASAASSLLVINFENRTGLSEFDGPLNYALETRLGESQRINIVSAKRVEEQLRYMRRRPGTISDIATAREVCLRDGDINAIIAPRIEKVGSSFLLSSPVLDCSGETRFVARAEAANESSVLAAIDVLGMQVRESLGVSNADPRGKLQPVTTTSLSALKLFTDARRHMAVSNWQDIDTAINLLQQAVAIDPEFAMAWSQLAAAVTWRCEFAMFPTPWKPADAGPYFEKSLQLVANTSEHEKYLIIGRYHRDWSMDVYKEVSAFETLHSLYPEDLEATDDLAFAYMRAGRGDDAERLTLEVADRRMNDFETNWGAWRRLCGLLRPADAERLRIRAISLVTPEVRRQHSEEIVQMDTQPLVDLLNAGRIDEVVEIQKKREAEFYRLAAGEEREVLATYLAKIYFDVGQLKLADEWNRRANNEGPFSMIAFAAARGDKNTLKAAVLSALGSPRVAPSYLYDSIGLGMRGEALKKLPALRYDRRMPSMALVHAELDRTEGKTRAAVQEFHSLEPTVHATAGWFEPVMLDRMALAQEDLGDLPGAVATLEINAAEPMIGIEMFVNWRPQARLHLARLYYKTGRAAAGDRIVAELRKLYQAADPDFVPAQQVHTLEQEALLALRARAH